MSYGEAENSKIISYTAGYLYVNFTNKTCNSDSFKSIIDNYISLKIINTESISPHSGRFTKTAVQNIHQ